MTLLHLRSFLDFKAENKKLKAQNDKLRRQIDELNDKFQMISSKYKSLQESNELLMEINQEFGRENDQLQADLKEYQLFELPKILNQSSDDEIRTNKHKSKQARKSKRKIRSGSERHYTRPKGKRYK